MRSYPVKESPIGSAISEKNILIDFFLVSKLQIRILSLYLSLMLLSTWFFLKDKHIF